MNSHSGQEIATELSASVPATVLFSDVLAKGSWSAPVRIMAPNVQMNVESNSDRREARFAFGMPSLEGLVFQPLATKRQ